MEIEFNERIEEFKFSSFQFSSHRYDEGRAFVPGYQNILKSFRDLYEFRKWEKENFYKLLI